MSVQDYGHPPFIDHIDERFVVSDLDEKLQYILTQFDKPENKGKRWEVTVDKIKQAFIDAGWVKKYKTDSKGDVTIPAYVEPPIIVDASAMLMTGQEWYDRFVQQFLSDNVDHQTYEPKKIEWTNVLKAARKAAGIE